MNTAAAAVVNQRFSASGGVGVDLGAEPFVRRRTRAV
jgi:hypothetical protein